MKIPAMSIYDYVSAWSTIKPQRTSYTQRDIRHHCKFGQLLPFDSEEWIEVEW